MIIEISQSILNLIPAIIAFIGAIIFGLMGLYLKSIYSYITFGLISMMFIFTGLILSGIIEIKII